MMNQNNVLYVFVAKKAQTALPTGNVESLSDGYVGIATLDGTFVNTALTAGNKVRIVKKKNGVLQFSPEFDIANVKQKTSATYSADTQYVGYLGYNGVDGTLPADIDTVYTPKLIVNDTQTTFGNKAMIKEAVYKTSKSAPVYPCDVASGLAKNFVKNMEKEPEEFVKIDVVTSHAGTSLTGGSLTEGSKTATVTSGVSAGDWLKASSGESYKVISKTSSTEAVLDRASNVSSSSIYHITESEAQDSTTKWGLKFTGQARTNFVPGIWKNFVYNFQLLQGANMDDVPVTETKAVIGTCTNNQVAEEEWFAEGNRGYGYRADVIPVSSQVSVEYTGADYNGVYIKVSSSQFTNVIGQSPASLVENKVYGVASFINEVKTVLGI